MALLKVILLSSLFVATVAATCTFLAREHLTVTDDTTLTRIGALEDDYKKLKETIESQEKRMGSAATEAAQKQALLHSTTRR